MTFDNTLLSIQAHGCMDKLNSLTKYPSILVYHQRNDKGKLIDLLEVGSHFKEDDKLYVMEKIDGTNSRIILDGTGDYIIGSREELLHAKGDRILNSAHGIVDVCKPIAEKLSELYKGQGFKVIYLESFGGRITSTSKNYCKDRNITSARVFDIMQLDPNMVTYELSLSKVQIACRRDAGLYHFLPYSQLMQDTDLKDIVSIAPWLCTIDGSEMETELRKTGQWLQQFKKTTLLLSADGLGKSEGVIVRNNNRSVIRKIRFEDYNRALVLR